MNISCMFFSMTARGAVRFLKHVSIMRATMPLPAVAQASAAPESFLSSNAVTFLYRRPYALRFPQIAAV